MRLHPSLVAILPLALLVGCSAVNGGSNTVYPNISGNWSIATTATPATTPVATLNGSLQNTGSTVTGVLHAQDIRNVQLACISLPTDIAVSGTVDATGKISVSGPIAGGTLTLTGTANIVNLQLPSVFTLTIAGGTCAETAQTAAGVVIAPVTGSYSGTLNQANSASSAVVIASLTQSTTPDAHGFFALNGTIAASGSACTASFSLTNEAMLGPLAIINPNAPATVTTNLFSGFVTPDAKTLNVALLSSLAQGAKCPGISGTLTKS